MLEAKRIFKNSLANKAKTEDLLKINLTKILHASLKQYFRN